MREFVKSTTKSSSNPASNLSLVDPSKPSTWYIQSNHPDDFGDVDVKIPSVIAELTYNYKQYHVDRSDAKATNWFTFTSYPDDIRMIVDTMRRNVNFTASDNGVGSQVTISCCLTLGLTRLNASGAIKRLKEIHSSFDKRKKEGSPIEQFISRYLDMEVPIQARTGRRLKVPVTPDVKNQIISISEDTGLTQSNVGVLCMYATLAQQLKDAPENYREDWGDRLDQSLELIECKVRGAKAIMEMLK